MPDIFKVKWKVSLCEAGENCWCRAVEPIDDILDEDDNKIFIAPAGSMESKIAEYLVKLHNLTIKDSE